MSKSINEKIYESKLVLEAVKKFPQDFVEYGVDDRYIQDYEKNVNEAQSSFIDFTGASNEIKELTRKQNELAEEVTKNISVLKNLVRYRIKDKTLQDKLRIGIKMPSSVTKLIEEGGIILKSAKESRAKLDEHRAGAIVDKLELSYNELIQTDTHQELHKKESRQGKEARDVKIEEMEDMTRYVQKVAANIYKKKPELKAMFFKYIVTRNGKVVEDSTVIGTENKNG